MIIQFQGFIEVEVVEDARERLRRLERHKVHFVLARTFQLNVRQLRQALLLHVLFRVLEVVGKLADGHRLVTLLETLDYVLFHALTLLLSVLRL